LAWVFLACLTAIVIPAAILPVFQLPGAQGVPFLVVFMSVWAYMIYSMAFRAIYRMRLTETELCWHSLVRTGAIPLSQLTSIRYRSSRLIIIEATGRKPLRVSAVAGIADFTADLKRAAPQVEVRQLSETAYRNMRS
jgi:hypothetical protein